MFLNRAAAREGQTANYDLVISITEEAPMQGEEKPAAGVVPQKVIDDCFAKLCAQLGDRGMKLISATRGENSFIVDVQADAVEKPWRCFHDGTQCTGSEYQGEGEGWRKTLRRMKRGLPLPEGMWA